MLPSVFIAISVSLFSEDVEFDVGKIKPADLEVNVCPIDSNAGAWVIGEFGDIDYKYTDGEGFDLYFKHKVRIKILKNTEFSNATFVIPIFSYAHGWEKIDIDGCTYNLEDGKVIKSKLTKDSRFEELVNKNRKNIKVTLPNVREGSVIDLEYTITSQYIWEVRDWFFQQDIPVLYSRLITNFPEYFTFKKFLNGFIEIQNKQEQVNSSIIYTEKERNDAGMVTQSQFYTGKIDYINYRNTYTAINIPAFKEEPYLTSERNYISLMEYDLESVQYPHSIPQYFTKDWNSINKELMEDEDFGLLLNRSGFISDTVKKITGNLSDDVVKATAIYNYLHTYMKWNGINRKYASGSLKKAYDSKSGNSAEINLLLTVMLREAGIQADPVLLSTRNNGIALIAYPIIDKFNYAIAAAKINGKTYLMDATDPYIPFGMLPPRCLNGEGRIINLTNSETVQLTAAASYGETKILAAKLDPENGNFSGSMRIYCKGYDASEKRSNIAGAKSKDDYIKTYQDNYPGLTIGSYVFLGLDTLEKSVQCNFNDVTITNSASVSGDIITFDPLIFGQMKNNPFKLEERKYPVDYTYPREETFILQLDIPEGYSVDEIPKSIAISLPDNVARYMYNITATNGKLQLMAKLSIIKTVFDESEYKQLKEFYSQIVAKDAQLIVLKKNTIQAPN